MINHTPGPWAIEPEWIDRCGGEVSVVNREHPGHDWDVCTVHSTEANARLISAAPEMIQILIDIRDELRMFYSDDEPYNNPRLNEVIAKATGESA